MYCARPAAIGTPACVVTAGGATVAVRLPAHPLARALIAKTVGDNIEVTTPGGSKAYEILKIEFR